MSLRKFVSLLVGGLAVLALAVTGLLNAYTGAHRLAADQAVITSEQSVVGTPFAGSVDRVAVRAGDRVEAGQELLRIQTPSLEQALETSRFAPEGPGYRVEGEDTLVFTATGAGTVNSVALTEGSFVPANSEMLRLDLAGTAHVSAQVPLGPRDFARLPLGSAMTVELPDRSTVELDVYDIHFADVEGGTPVATVLARGADLSGAGAFVNGSPVGAELHLDDSEGLGAWVARQLGKLAEPNGINL